MSLPSMAPTLPPSVGALRSVAHHLPAPPVQALSTPPVAVRVEWAAAIRPADAAMRVSRPEGRGKADPEPLTGPPPAFAANVLDQLPDSLTQRQAAAPRAREGTEATAPAPRDATVGAAAPAASGLAGGAAEWPGLLPQPGARVPEGARTLPAASALPTAEAAYREGDAATARSIDLLV